MGYNNVPSFRNIWKIQKNCFWFLVLMDKEKRARAYFGSRLCCMLPLWQWQLACTRHRCSVISSLQLKIAQSHQIITQFVFLGFENKVYFKYAPFDGLIKHEAITLIFKVKTWKNQFFWPFVKLISKDAIWQNNRQKWPNRNATATFIHTESPV